MESFVKKYAKDKETKKTASYSSYDEKNEDTPVESVPSFVKDYGNMSEKYQFDFGEGLRAFRVVLVFDKTEHAYYRIEYIVGSEPKWVKVPGITTILSIKDKSNALIPWAVRETVSYVKSEYMGIGEEDMQVILSTPQSHQEWLFDCLDEAAKNYRDISKDAADVGKEAHDWLESHVNARIAKDNDRILDLLEERKLLDKRAQSCCAAALLWMANHNVRWKFTERRIYSLQYDCAGTLDGCCLVDSCNDPECCPKPFTDHLSIIDWKSSNALYDTYRWQTAAYEFALEEELGWDIQDRWVIQLGKYDGVFNKWHIGPEDFDMDLQCFLDCLALTRSTERCVETLRARKREVKEFIRAEKLAKEEAEKTERFRIKYLKKELRQQRDVVYKVHRNNGHSVSESNLCADAWLKRELEKLGE